MNHEMFRWYGCGCVVFGCGCVVFGCGCVVFGCGLCCFWLWLCCFLVVVVLFDFLVLAVKSRRWSGEDSDVFSLLLFCRFVLMVSYCKQHAGASIFSVGNYDILI